MKKIIFILLAVFISIFLYLKSDSYNQKSVILSSSLPKTGVTKQWGESVLVGANSYFNYSNDNNLLNGKKIIFTTYDDKYEPELTINNLKYIINRDRAFALFGFVGTPTVKNIIPIIKEEDIPLFAPFTGASFLRKNEDRNYINFRTSYEHEIEEIIKHLIYKKKIKKFSVFYQNDDYGEEGYISTIKSLKKRDKKLVSEGSYKRNTLSIRHAFNEIKESTPEAVIMIGASKANALFIKKAKEDKNFKDTIFCNISFGDADATIKELKFLNTNTKNIIFSQVVPNYMDDSIPVIKEYQKILKFYYPNKEFSFISLEAFLASKVVVDALARVEGYLTRKKFLFSLKNTPEDLLEGLTLNYKNNQLLNKVFLYEYKNNRFKELNNGK